MKHILIIASVLLLPLSADAVGIKQVTRQSVPAKMTIISGCENNGVIRRSMAQKNWQAKCKKRQRTRLRNTRARKSQILNNNTPRLRSSRVSRPKATTTTKISSLSPLQQRLLKLLGREKIQNNLSINVSSPIRPEYQRPVRRSRGTYDPYYRPGK
jgi:hypothetical protein